MGVIVLQGSCPQGSCPKGSCPRGSCPRGNCPVTIWVQLKSSDIQSCCMMSTYHMIEYNPLIKNILKMM